MSSGLSRLKRARFGLVLGLVLATATPLTLIAGSAPATSASLVSAVGTDERAPSVSANGRTVTLGSTGEVSAGGEYSCGLRGTGTLWCWGRNTYGQLGLGRMGPDNVAPEQVGKLDGWTQVSAGGSTTCAIRVSRALFCWGLNHRGQIGDGAKAAVDRPKRLPGEKNWKQVSTAWFHTCGVRTTGTLWCWGDNSSGQLGVGTTKQDLKLHQVPGATWTSVSTAGWNTCATKLDGSLWCWGRNGFGQLGIGSMINASKPARVGTATNWAQVSLSWTHACGLQNGGAVRCWGRNDQGQVGEGAPIYALSPFLVPGEHSARSLAVAEGTSCLVDSDAALWCWGDNRYGQVSPQAPPVPGARFPVRRGGSFTTLSGGWFHLCAESTTSSVVCWGNNERGQLGDGAAPSSRHGARQPVATPRRREGPLRLRLASMNTLGNHHSRPNADADNFGPSRVRADWTAQSILNNGIQVIGIQEQDAGQLSAIVGAAEGALASYPSPEAGDLGVEAAILWDTRTFEFVAAQRFRSQFIARTLPRPVVKLREKASGREFWVMNVHNAPWTYQTKRNQATKVQIERLVALEQSGLPVFYVGDMNEKKTIFCKVLTQTGLDSASGGRVTGTGECLPPRLMRVDWIFGSKAVNWSGFAYTKTPLARLSTDHWVPMVDVEVP